MFRALLLFIYTDELPATANMEKRAPAHYWRLRMALAFLPLKLLLPSPKLSRQALNVDNTAELLLYADAHCFVLCSAKPPLTFASPILPQ
jgi:hypothetical protein